MNFRFRYNDRLLNNVTNTNPNRNTNPSPNPNTNTNTNTNTNPNPNPNPRPNPNTNTNPSPSPNTNLNPSRNTNTNLNPNPSPSPNIEFSMQDYSNLLIDFLVNREVSSINTFNNFLNETFTDNRKKYKKVICDDELNKLEIEKFNTIEATKNVYLH